MQLVAYVLAGLVSASPSLGPTVPQHIDVRLIAETTAPRSGESLLIGLQMTPEPGWHDYWKNPGEAGIAPVVKWTAPNSISFGPLRHPAPTLLKVQELTSFVHAGPHVLISRMTVARNLRPGTALPITANISWAACSDKLCVPEHTALSLQMTVGDGKPSPDAVALRHAVAAEPKATGAGAFQVTAGKLVLQLPASTELDARHAHFFPDDNGFFDAAHSRTTSIRPLRIEGPVKGSVPPRITGVVSDGSVAFRIGFRRSELSRTPAKTGGQSRLARDVRSPRLSAVQRRATPIHSTLDPRRLPTTPRLVEAALAAFGLLAVAALIARRRRKSEA